jgi:very-short-patch-repair endonuclease
MTIERARQLRKSMSPAEARMWTMLRTEPFKALHFRRQRQIGPFYADFASFKAKLVIEIDGGQHYEDAAMQYDARRTKVIEAEGYAVLRFATTDVMHHLDGVHAAMLAAVGLTQ